MRYISSSVSSICRHVQGGFSFFFIGVFFCFVPFWHLCLGPFGMFSFALQSHNESDREMGVKSEWRQPGKKFLKNPLTIKFCIERRIYRFNCSIVCASKMKGRFDRNKTPAIHGQFKHTPHNHNFNPFACASSAISHVAWIEVFQRRHFNWNDLVYNCQPNHISHLNCSYAALCIAPQFVRRSQSISLPFRARSTQCLFAHHIHLGLSSFSPWNSCIKALCVSACASKKWLEAKIVLPII